MKPCASSSIYSEKSLALFCLKSLLPPKSKLNLRIISLTEGSAASRYSIFWGMGVFGLPFYVGRGVLIPRQDTETLVETVIESSRNFIKPKIIDLCSGSGCIACSVSAYVKNAEVYALEKSERAIGYLNKNIELNKSKITLIQADVLKPEAALVYGNFDIIACNPPYLTANDMNYRLSCGNGNKGGNRRGNGHVKLKVKRLLKFFTHRICGGLHAEQCT